ncbi:MAG: DUF6713 family protein [Chloroflexota bacterium]
METLVYLCGLACLFNHELDAIQQEEWRFFLGWSSLSDEAAYRLFTALHLPLFVLILWYTPSVGFRVGMDMFLIAHAGVHWLLRSRPVIRFNSAFSRVWIFGGGSVCGSASGDGVRRVKGL